MCLVRRRCDEEDGYGSNVMGMKGGDFCCVVMEMEMMGVF